MTSHFKWSAALLSLSLLIPSVTSAAEKVTLRLDWSYWGGHAPYFVAVERGTFARHGLEVAVQDGKGSRITAMVVGEGKDDLELLIRHLLQAASLRDLALRLSQSLWPRIRTVSFF
jgi:ABC-type nitrate/sulfonate/bicarbonate transport system substrate-binding protein